MYLYDQSISHFAYHFNWRRYIKVNDSDIDRNRDRPSEPAASPEAASEAAAAGGVTLPKPGANTSTTGEAKAGP